ncbi:HtaA domain-containing protein [Glaciihabitans sp. dw_435]|uniref:HtaA domain-containing protein n=1 Tax=Glaciihabitans sp. dw_435 TaxID=2720081 RepID=UPI001BD29020|nr:HtaA domain-containing protein [Glaciihabitans sp. dw_435]
MKSRFIPRIVATASVTAVIAAGLLAAAPTYAADSPAYAIGGTTPAGALVRSQALDGAANRLYFPFDRGSSKTGAIGWMNTETGEVSPTTIELADSEPALLAVSSAAHELYVLGYRSGDLTVINTQTNAVKKVIEGAPTLAGRMNLDTDTGELYVTDAGITTIDPAAGTVSAEVSITTETYPLIKDTVYDSKNRMLWIAEGRAGVITGYNTVTNSWMSSIATPITTFKVDGVASSGRPTNLAVDESLGHLYVGVAPKLADTWVNTKLMVLDTATMLHVGTPIELGSTTRELSVNPVTHEIYAGNGFSITLSVVSPATWTVSTTIDFSAAGVTSGTGTANANVWAVTADDSGTRVFVSHPYNTARISYIDRTGAIAAPTTLPVAPGQTVTEPEVPPTTPWVGPATKAVAAAPAGAVATSATTLRWSVSNYAKEWTRDLFGAVTLDATKQFVFANGTGWTDPATGETQVSWADGFRLRPYPGLAPDVQMTFGNPYLTVSAAGAGTLSFDVSWGLSSTSTSAGYTRVVVATFGKGAAQDVDGVRTLTWTPDYTGRAYTLPNDGRTMPDSFPAEYIDYLDSGIRAWWYSSGSTLDPTKKPNPVSVSYSLAATGAATNEPTPPPTSVPTETPTPVATDDPAAPVIALSTDTVEAGSTVSMHATGFAPGETGEIWLHSTPLLLDSALADAAGTVDSVVTIPDGTTAGAHRIELRMAESGSVFADITVAAAGDGTDETGTGADDDAAGSGDLASTGVAVAVPLGIALTVLLAGAVLVIARRRRAAQH